MSVDPAARILIAGAGPVGLTAAVELHRRGFTPRIIDPDLAVSPESRALAINPRTLDLLEPSGVTEALLAAGIRIGSALFRTPERTLFKMNIGLANHRFNFMLCLPQSQTETILESALRARSIEVERGVALQSFAQDGPRIAAHLTNGSSAAVDYLIGADGAHSTTRKGLGLDFHGISAPQVFGLADVELDDWPFPWDQGVATLHADHVVIFFPMRIGFGRFITTCPDTMNHLPAIAKVRKCVWASDFHISYRQVSNYQKNNVFLAGDAAHIHSPVGGRGMNLGIEDASWLAYLIAEGRADSYSALRRPVGEKVLKFTAGPTGFISSKSFAARTMRRWVIPRLLGMEWLQRRLLPSILALDTPTAPWL